jgi:hypothetical protein
VIPTMMLFGLVLGRWWRVALVTAAIGWPLLLVATDVVAFNAGLIGAAVLAVANAGVGVLAHQGCLGAYRHLNRRVSHTVPG